MRRLVLSLGACAIALLTAAPPGSGAFVTCRSGDTEFRKGSTRVFSVRVRADGDFVLRYYVCSKRLRTPRAFHTTETEQDETFSDWKVTRRLLTFHETIIAGDSQSYAMGWVSLVTGKHRITYIEGHGVVLGGPAVDEDGGIAHLEHPDPDFDADFAGPRYDEIFYSRPGKRQLHGPKRIAYVTTKDVVASSLRARNGVVTWRTKAGGRGSAKVTDRPRKPAGPAGATAPTG